MHCINFRIDYRGVFWFGRKESDEKHRVNVRKLPFTMMEWLPHVFISSTDCSQFTWKCTEEYSTEKNYSLENTSRNVISWMLDRWDILGIMSLERSLPLDMLFLLHSIVTIFMHLAHTHTNTSIPFLSVIIKSHSTVPMSTPVEDGQWCSLLSVCTLLCTYRTIGNHRSSGITAMKKTRDRHRDSLLTWFLTIFSVDILSIFA